MLKLLFNIFLFYFSVFGLTSLINAQFIDNFAHDCVQFDLSETT